MVRIEEICDKVKHNHPQADVDLLRRAYLFSAREHKGQKRASGEAYLVHPLEVANILADMRLDAVSVATGLLHDVVEDDAAAERRLRDGIDTSCLVEAAVGQAKWIRRSSLEARDELLLETDGLVDRVVVALLRE